MRSLSFSLAALTLALAAGSASADTDSGFFDEFRLGAYKHDVSFLGHGKETGADVGAEILFHDIGILWAPRPVAGILVNTAGETDQIYGGLTWTWDVFSNILNEGDGFYLEGTLGGAIHNGKLDVTDPYESQHRKSLGSPVLFREDFDIGYHFNPVWSLAITYEHISDADLAKRNEGLNDIGLRVGMKF